MKKTFIVVFVCFFVMALLAGESKGEITTYPSPDGKINVFMLTCKMDMDQYLPCIRVNAEPYDKAKQFTIFLDGTNGREIVNNEDMLKWSPDSRYLTLVVLQKKPKSSRYLLALFDMVGKKIVYPFKSVYEGDYIEEVSFSGSKVSATYVTEGITGESANKLCGPDVSGLPALNKRYKVTKDISLLKSKEIVSTPVVECHPICTQ